MLAFRSILWQRSGGGRGVERRLFQKSPEPSGGQSLCQGRCRGVQREEVSSGDVKEVELAKKMVVFFPKLPAALLQCVFHGGCC